MHYKSAMKYTPVFVLAVAVANAQTISNPTAAAACFSELSAGFTAANSVCGRTFDYSLNVTGAILNDTAAYTAYLDTVCSTACVNAVGKTVRDSKANCMFYPYGKSTMGDVVPLNYKHNFQYACLKEGGEYCLVKQIKTANAAGKTVPSDQILLSSRTDLCVPCLMNQTTIMTSYYGEFYTLQNTSSADIAVTQSMLRTLQNNCPANTLANGGAITNVNLFDLTAPASTVSPSPTATPTPSTKSSSIAIRVSYAALSLVFFALY